MSERGRPILLVEDNPDDIFLIEKALAKVSLAAHLEVARDGIEAVHYLEGKEEFADRGRFPLPALIVLDLKLPRMSGLELLAWVRGRPDLAKIPVVVLTSSNDVSDIRSAYELGAVSYHVKPAGIRELITLSAAIRDCWSDLQEGRPCQRLPGALLIPGG
jgi:CheY-like chemotaxis protein